MSNLLDRSSLVLTPTAYNNGEALCIKPDDASGDFTFSRNSAATRVNAQGLVENVQILSSNLVQNGSFSEEGVQEVSNGSFSQEGSEEITNGDFENGSTGWALNGWTISNGKANCNGITANLIQSNVGSANKTFKLVFTISNYISGKVIPSFVGLSNESLEYNANGTYTTYISSLTDLRFVFYGNLFNGSIDNVSVREVGQDWNLIGTATITENQANIVTASAVTGISQSNILTIGKSYKLSYNIVSNNNGGLKISGNEIPSVVGNNIYYFEASAASLEILRNSGITDISITNISVKEVGQNWSIIDADANNYVQFGDGTARLKFLNTSPVTTLKTSFAMTTGKKYKLTVDVLSITSGSIKVANAGINETFDTVGISTRIINPTAATTLNFYRATANVDLTLNSVNLIEITTDTSLPRINYEGFSYQDVLSSELVTNGSFDSDTAWNKNSNWSISGNTANCDGTSNGDINQGTTLATTGKSYRITFDVVSISQGEFFFKFGGVNGTFRNSIGTYTETIQAINSNRISLDSLNNAIGSIDNVSVKEYLGQSVVPDSGCGSWLWESQSTNLITQSELFSDSSWLRVGSITTTDNYTTSPSGQNNGTRLQWTNATNYIYQSLSHVGSDFTLSIYLKSNTNVSQNVRLFMDNGAQAKDVVVTTQWQRFELTNTTTPTQSNRNVGLIKSGGQVGDLDISIWGAQFEALSYATSYIPTSGSSYT